ncbi:MAG: thermosome subunit alpha [Halanaerobiales bacterium]
MNKNMQPIFILPDDSKRSSGKDAQRNNIAASKAVADAIKSTLGPKGMDKMLVDSLGEVTVTNDGAAILEEVEISHPAAKMIVEIAKTQEIEVGDGTTSAVVLAGELLKSAESLLDKNIHPTLIIKGYQMANNKALEVLNDLSKEVDIDDKETLKKISMTAMTGKGAESSKEYLSDILVDAIEIASSDSEFDEDNVKIEKMSGNDVEESKLIKGILLDKNRVHSDMPKKKEDAKVLLLTSPIEVKNTEIDANIQINDPSQIQGFIDQEDKILKKKVNKIKDLGADVVFCQKGIDDAAQSYLSKNGIFAIRRVKKSDMSRLAKSTGAKLISGLEDSSKEDLGFAGTIEELKIGNQEMTVVRDSKESNSATILLRGGSDHIVTEIKRAFEDAIGDIKSVLSTGKVLCGAGAVEAELYKELKQFASKHSGRIQLALDAFAESMLVIPKAISENAGLDPIDVITNLNKEHDAGNKNSGIDIESGNCLNSLEKGIIEPFSLKMHAINSAREVAVMILRIDDVISSSSKKDQAPKQNMPQSMPNFG